MNLIINFLAALVCKLFPEEVPDDPYDMKKRFGRKVKS